MVKTYFDCAGILCKIRATGANQENLPQMSDLSENSPFHEENKQMSETFIFKLLGGGE